MMRVMEVMLNRRRAADNEETLLSINECVAAGRVVGLAVARGQMSYRQDSITIMRDGIVGDAHRGQSARVRAGDRIVRSLVPNVSTKNNTWQVRLVSLEDSAVIANTMRLPKTDTHVPFGLQAENVVVQGLELGNILPGMRLAFVLPNGDVPPLLLNVNGAALPSETPISVIDRHYVEHGIRNWRPVCSYAQAAAGHSGLALTVEAVPKEGVVIPDDCFVVAFMPNK